MKNFWKRLNCKHDYHVMNSYMETFMDRNANSFSRLQYSLFCPKCDKTTRVDAVRYDEKKKEEETKRKIKERYAKGAEE